MKCLYCGEPLALTLLKRFTGGGEFCSDGCKAKYQIEFTQLAVGRLQQARPASRRPMGVALGDTLTPEAATPEAATPEAATPEAATPEAAEVKRPPLVAGPLVAEMPTAEMPPVREALPEPVALEEAKAEPIAPPEPEWLVPEAPMMKFGVTAQDWRGVMALPLLAMAAPEQVDLRLAGAPAKVDPPRSFTEPWPVEPEPEPELPEAGFAVTKPLGAATMAPRLRSAAIQPAPVTVYLQFPLDPQRTRYWRPRLAASDLMERPVAVAEWPFRPYGRVGSPLEGFHQALEQGPRSPGRRVRLRAGMSGWCDYDWVDRASVYPVAALNSVFPARGPGFSAVGAGLELAVEDARFDQFLRPAAREELIERIRRMRRTAPLAESVGKPVTMEEVKPALDLLKSIGESLAARPEVAAEAGALIPMRRPRALSPPAPAALPAPVIDPALLPSTASPGGSALPGGSLPTEGASAANPLAGLVGPGSQAFLFGTEFAVASGDAPVETEPQPEPEATALAPLEAERLPEAPGETSAAPATGLSTTGLSTSGPGPTFNQVAGFGPPAGGSMNIGTMVVVNQPAGAVTINAAPSATAATFEARLKGRTKELGPLENIAEPVGLQTPAPTAAAALPLRMNFAGCLTAATPIHWPVLSSACMRRKFFFGPAPKSMGPAKRPDLAGAPAANVLRPAPRATVPRVANPAPALATPPPVTAASEEANGGGWWKSLSGRFGRK